MIRNTVINTVNYFYPLGNTPAVSLTQDLPFGKHADVLLLGCGDARNVLFTCFADPDRKLDITCCDIEETIIARNIFLYTLLLDDTKCARLEQIWNIYFHWKLDDESLSLFEAQTEKLITLSKTSSAWYASEYGTVIRFCDLRTLTQCHKVWSKYSSRGLSTARKSQRQTALQNNISRARKIRQEILGDGTSFSGVRSAAPTGILAVRDFPMVATRWWKDGITSSGDRPNLASNHLNPTFLWSASENLTLHYGTDPLLGFPLATAYVPLSKKSTLYVKKEGTSSAEHLTVCARLHFRHWVQSFRKNVSEDMVIRFCIADALAFAMTLRNATSHGKEGTLSANLYCDSWTCDPLVLDGSEFADSKPRAPRQFDVIDTSNLIDHLGSLNLLPVSAALLKNQTDSGTIYTESLFQSDSTEKERVARLLGGDIRTVALLLGLSPCEIWTNATNSPEDESIPNAISNRLNAKNTGSSTQIRSRLRWKHIHSTNGDEVPFAVHLEAGQVAHLLVKLYSHMFEYEDVHTLLRSLSTNGLSRRSNPFYNRASFTILLKSIQRTTATNWSKCLEEMMSTIVSGFSHSPYGANCVQEFLLYMHMFDVDTSRLPTVDLFTSKDARMTPFFKAWSDVPVQVCVTIRVPRENLRPFTSRAITITGTPTLRCDIEDGGLTPRQWSNTFAAVKVSFGDALRSLHEGTPMLRIEQDDSNWWGLSDMFVSMFVPTWMILQSNETTPVVKCGLLPTPLSCKMFVKDLGPNLDIFSSELTSVNVIVSRYMPAMSGLPRLTSEEPPPQPEPHRIFSAAISLDDTSIKTLAQRLFFVSEVEKSKLRDQSIPVQVQFQDTVRFSVKIGQELEYSASFPVPIDENSYKVRIARKSSYVEIEVQPWNPLTEKSSCLLFPFAPLRKSPGKPFGTAPWTATQLRLDILPEIVTKDKDRIKWLITHASMMFSTRERQIRDDGIANRVSPDTKSNIRLEMKDGLFSILMSYTGLQGHCSSNFGLSKAVGGINVLLLPSCLRLDIINRTVVLDVAAIPLTNKMNADKKVRAFYQSLQDQGVMQINVSDEELRCWKSVLPAFVERCRLWKHILDCEYASKGEIPVTKGLEDGRSPICSCGIGKFPIDYLKDSKLNNIEYMLRRYATRAAISPIFAVPYVEDCFLTGSPDPEAQPPTSITQTVCGNCGRAKRADVISEGELLVCSRCRRMKYCSKDCQKAHWKSHKGSCVQDQT